MSKKQQIFCGCGVCIEHLEIEDEHKTEITCPECRGTSILTLQREERLKNDAENCGMNDNSGNTLSSSPPEVEDSKNDDNELNNNNTYNNNNNNDDNNINDEKLVNQNKMNAEEEKEEEGEESGIMINYAHVEFICSYPITYRPVYIEVDYAPHYHHDHQYIIISGYDNDKIHIYKLSPNINNDEENKRGGGGGGGCKLIRTIGNNGSGNMQFNYPMGVAVLHEECDDYQSGDDMMIIIADYNNHRIQICSWKGEFIRSFGSQGNGHLQFNNPYGVALLRTTSSSFSSSKQQNIIIISDCNNHRIQIWSVEGEFIRSFGKYGSGNMQFICPTGVAIHSRSGNIIIADSGNDRIQICSVEGEFIRSFGCKGSANLQFSSPKGIAVLNHHHHNTHPHYGDDHIINSDYGNHRIQICSMKGEFLRSFGSKGSGDMQFICPWGVAVLHHNHHQFDQSATHNNNNDDADRYSPNVIIIADYNNKRIQLIGESKWRNITPSSNYY